MNPKIVLGLSLTVLISFYALLIDHVWTDRSPFNWKNWKRKKDS